MSFKKNLCEIRREVAHFRGTSYKDIDFWFNLVILQAKKTNMDTYF